MAFSSFPALEVNIMELITIDNRPIKEFTENDVIQIEAPASGSTKSLWR